MWRVTTNDRGPMTDRTQQRQGFLSVVCHLLSVVSFGNTRQQTPCGPHPNPLPCRKWHGRGGACFPPSRSPPRPTRGRPFRTTPTPPYYEHRRRAQRRSLFAWFVTARSHEEAAGGQPW